VREHRRIRQGPAGEILEPDRATPGKGVVPCHEQHQLLVREDRADGHIWVAQWETRCKHVQLPLPQQVEIVAPEPRVDHLHVAVGLAGLEGLGLVRSSTWCGKDFALVAAVASERW
jgi:hypothetical protein